jgi:hypothetical protein
MSRGPLEAEPPPTRKAQFKVCEALRTAGSCCPTSYSAIINWQESVLAGLARLRLLLEGFELRSRRGSRRYEKRLSSGKPPVEEIVTREL